MNKLPIDIQRKIDQGFTAEEERQQVTDVLTKLCAENAVVGAIIQAIRGIIFLADKDIEKIRDFCLPHLQEDPRDIILEAEQKAGNPGHWFNIPFDEMEDFSEES